MKQERSRKDSRYLTSLGERLTAHRLEAAQTQVDIARKLEVSRALVGRWETGVCAMMPYHILGVCKILGVSPNKLMGWDK